MAYRSRKPPKTAAQLGVKSKTKKLGKRMLKPARPPVASAALSYDKPGHTRKVARPSGTKVNASANVIGVAGNVIRDPHSYPVPGAKKRKPPRAHGRPAPRSAR